MTRKHYKAMAIQFKTEKNYWSSHLTDKFARAAVLDALRGAVIKLAVILKDENPSFDRDKFLAACELEFTQ